LDELFARIDVGEVAIGGHDGLIQQLIKAGLQGGLQAELTDHLGYELGDPAAGLFRIRATAVSQKQWLRRSATASSTSARSGRDLKPDVGPEGIAPAFWLGRVIISLYAGGMTLRDIEYHLATTVGNQISRETLSKIVDEVCDEVLAWQRRPLEAFYPVIYLEALVVKVRDGPHVRNKAVPWLPKPS
jgi:transposase-like protein